MDTGRFTLLFLAVTLLGCGVNQPPFRDPDAAEVDGATDAPDVDAMVDAAIDAPDAQPGDWNTIEPITAVNTSGSEDGPALSADRLELYFTRRAQETGTPRYIFVSRRASTVDPWGAPVQVPDTLNCTDPEISPDGLELYCQVFTTMYRMTRANTSAAWGPKVQVFSSAQSPSLPEDALTLYYARLGTGAGLKQRARSTLMGTWGAEQVASILSNGYVYNYVALDRSATFAVLTAAYTQGIPDVLLVSRSSPTSAWDAPEASATLESLRARDCYAVSPTELYCVIITLHPEHGSLGNIFRMRRQ